MLAISRPLNVLFWFISHAPLISYAALASPVENVILVLENIDKPCQDHFVHFIFSVIFQALPSRLKIHGVGVLTAVSAQPWALRKRVAKVYVASACIWLGTYAIRCEEKVMMNGRGTSPGHFPYIKQDQSCLQPSAMFLAAISSSVHSEAWVEDAKYFLIIIRWL